MSEKKLNADDLRFKVKVDVQQGENDGEPLFFKPIASHISHLQGDVLTVIDAAFNDREQRKAVKDLLRGQFNRKLADLESICMHGGGKVNPYAPPARQ